MYGYVHPSVINMDLTHGTLVHEGWREKYLCEISVNNHSTKKIMNPDEAHIRKDRT